MKMALKQLITAFDKLADSEHGEISDTDVRERMYDVIHRTLIEPEAGYELPAEFGMFTSEGNKKVNEILVKFIAHPEFLEAKKLPTPKARLDAFQDGEVESPEGNYDDDYFGYSDSNESGDVVDTH